MGVCGDLGGLEFGKGRCEGVMKGMGVMGLGNGLDMYVCRHLLVGRGEGIGFWITWWTL